MTYLEKRKKLIDEIGLKEYMLLRKKAIDIHNFYLDQDIHVDIQCLHEVEYEAYIDIKKEKAIIELIKILKEK